MSFDTHDPRLTSYAFGELGAEEALHLEAELGESPEGQRALAEIRQLADALRSALATEAAPALPLAVRGEILAAAAATDEPHATHASVHVKPAVRSVARHSIVRRSAGWVWRHRVGTLLSGTLGLVAIGLLLPAMQPARQSSRVALNDSPAGSFVTIREDASQRAGSNESIPSDARLRGTRLAPSSYAAANPKGELYALPAGQAVPGQLAAQPVPPTSAGHAWYREAGAVVEDPTVQQDRYYMNELGNGQAQGVSMGGQPGIRTAPAASDLAVHRVPRMVILREKQELRELEDLPLHRGEERHAGHHNAEAYETIIERPFESVWQQPLSTFSIDVDTASYANVRRFLTQGALPPANAVRIEELLNYFHYDYAPPQDDQPFAAHTAVAACPWAPAHRLVRIAIKGKEIAVENRPASNLVFLLDVSGSMQDANKLPLVKDGLRLMIEKLGENDRVAIVVYAGASGLVLPSTLGSDKWNLVQAIDRLQAGGSTNGASGIQLAYEIAQANFIKGGVNRVILATDGDFNVGITDQNELVELIQQKAGGGVFLSVLGFGMGNLKDGTLEKLADKGNGNYAYIDNLREARKVLVEQLSGTLVTIAKDVKIQVEFNPARAQSYRLIGYENRVLAKEDFNDDTKDAGEIGAGHTVTALYEVVPTGVPGAPGGGVDKLEYQSQPATEVTTSKSNDLLMLKLRYKEPDGSESKLLKFPVADHDQPIAAAGDDFEFAAAVAAFGMLLRHSAHKGNASWGMVRELAMAGVGTDKEGYRCEFVALVEKAQSLSK